MKVEVIAFGIAKDIINAKSVNLEVSEGVTVGNIKEKLVNDYPAFNALVSLKLAVNAEYVEDHHILNENDEVVLIPPVSGG